MERSDPYGTLPIPLQHFRDGVQQDILHNNDFNAIQPQNILNFIPPLHDAHKESLNVHEYNHSSRENVQVENLHSSFKIGDDPNSLLDPFSPTHLLVHRTLQRDTYETPNNLQSHQINFAGQNVNVVSNNVIQCKSASESQQSQRDEIPVSTDGLSKSIIPIETLNHETLQDLGDHMKNSQSCQDLGLGIGTRDNTEEERINLTAQINPQSVQKVTLVTDSFLYEDVNQKLPCHDGPPNQLENQEKPSSEAEAVDYTFVCTFCPKSFKTQDRLERHTSLHPYGTSAIQCSKCGEILGNFMLLREHKQSEDYLSSCDICGQVFPNEECMVCHIRNTHNDFDDLFEDDCNTNESENASNVNESENASNVLCVQTQSKNESQMPVEVDNETNNLHLDSSTKEIVERPADETFFPTATGSEQPLSNLSNLQENFGEAVEQSESLCEKPSESKSAIDEEKSVKTEAADIPEAGVYSDHRSDFETNEQQEEQCKIEEQSAGEDSRSESGLSKPEKLRCQYCSKKCSSRKSLIRHERCHPYGTAAMKCNLCLEVVKNYKALKAHKKNQGSQVSCSTCDQLCPNETCLSCHVRNVHNNSVYEVYTIDDDDSNDRETESGYFVSRYTVSDPVAPLRITIKQEKDEGFERLASPTYSDSNPPTPPTPSFQGPPTPSPPAFVFEPQQSEEDEDEREEEDDEYEPYASDESVGIRKGKKLKRKSLRSTRRSSANSTQYSLSSEESDNDESGDFNYSPQSVSESDEGSDDAVWERPENLLGSSNRKTRKRNQISDDDSDVDPDWGKAKSSSSSAKKRGRRRKGALSDDSDYGGSWEVAQKSSRNIKKKPSKRKGQSSDDDSDFDPYRNSDESAPKVLKKKKGGRRGRKKKLTVQFFLPAIPVPKVNRPRAKGLCGQKAQDAAAALAQAVEDMETIVPELKTVIKPVRRSVTKASLKRFNETLDDEYDYLLDVKPEPKEDVEDSIQNVQNHEEDNSRTQSNEFLNGDSNEDLDGSKTVTKSWEDEKEEQVVIKAEPYDFQDDDQSTDLYFSRKFCENNTPFENSNSPSEKADCEAGDVSDTKKELRYVCKICGRALQYRSHLIRHLRKVHDGEGVEEVMRRMMKCRFCDKPYTNELSLINHEKLHDGTSKMKCNKCEERFDDKNALRRHQRKVHWEHAPVECEICKKQLSDNTCLKAHMKHMHGAEEKKVTVFTCETCGRQLHTKTAFQNHVASKCGTNLLFPCETCGKSFSFKGSLKAHQLLHTGVKSFLCKFCGKAFHQKGEMKRHERKHTGEKPFICEVCGRAFAYRESLLGHSAVHTGIKPFPCKACGMRFSCSGNLVKHRRSNNCKGPGGQSDNPDLASDVNPQKDSCTSRPSPVVEGIDILSRTIKPSGSSSIPNEGHISVNEANISSVESCAARQEKCDKQILEQIPSATQSQSPNHDANVTSAQPTQIPVPSVIKSTPTIHVKPTSALQSLPKEEKTLSESPQVHGNSSNESHRAATQFNQTHFSNEKSVTPQSNYNPSSYIENSFRQGNQVTPNERRFAQFSMENYAGRPDQYFDRQSLPRHEMNRQVIDRSVERQTPRYLDWTGGVQFGGIDTRNVMQSYSGATIPHTAVYPNLHSGHLGNYAAGAHATGHSNAHTGVYGTNAMIPGSVGFPTFSPNNQIAMGYSSNSIPAHSVTHSNSYPVSHMSHLEALFGHFTQPSGTVNSTFPRFSSQSSSNASNPSSHGNHRV
ncbi:Zinc finger protein 582 [Frankliniella fusca]|uniref:Zinc finger protein 582 n=1 Tax=Frankliniella fusca TaxID=407009 RepID=A0AAE1LBK1_9NEOP|nr:Zinc finger protein 582 [Frankliniella fusca]